MTVWLRALAGLVRLMAMLAVGVAVLMVSLVGVESPVGDSHLGWSRTASAAPAAPAQSLDDLCDAPIVGRACGAAGDAVGAVAEAGFEAVASRMAEAAEELLVLVVTAWTRVPSTSEERTEAIQAVQGDLLPLTAFVAVLGLIAAAVKLAFSRRGEDMREALAGLVRIMVVGSAGVTGLMLALEASDEFSIWLINESTEGGFNGELFALSALSPGLMFILGLLGIITGFIQIAFLLVRGALVVILAGAWQVSAAASITSAGAQTWKRITGWLVAMVLYKPAAAICYAAAFRLMGSGDGAATETLAVVEGMLILVLSVVALPAMVRLIVPAAASMGGPSAGAVVATGAAVATGAVAMGAGATAGAGAAGAGAGGQAGAAGASGASPPSGQSGSQAPSGNQAPADGSGPAGSVPGGKSSSPAPETGGGQGAEGDGGGQPPSGGAAGTEDPGAGTGGGGGVPSGGTPSDGAGDPSGETGGGVPPGGADDSSGGGGWSGVSGWSVASGAAEGIAHASGGDDESDDSGGLPEGSENG